MPGWVEHHIHTPGQVLLGMLHQMEVGILEEVVLQDTQSVEVLGKLDLLMGTLSVLLGNQFATQLEVVLLVGDFH